MRTCSESWPSIYADDCAGGKAEPEDLLLLAKMFLQRCVSLRFYVNPDKLTLICNELAWLGRVLRDGKVLVDPSYVAGVTELHIPQDAGSLSTLLGIIGWLAGNVPRLAEIRQPLVDVLAAAGKPAPTKSKWALASVPLTGRALGPRARRRARALQGGPQAGVARRRDIHTAVDRRYAHRVMSDASRLGWAGFVAACPTAELDKPVAAWQLRPVAFFGGVFTTAELA